MIVKLKDVFLIIRNGVTIKQTSNAGGFPVTRIETISNRTVDRKRMGYGGIYEIEKYSDYILQNDDILMSHINSEKHLGKVAIYTKNENEIIIHGMNLLMLRANKNKLFPKYSKYYFETLFFLSQINRITKKSVNQASFTVTALKELEIPLPPLEEQRHIAAVLDKVSDLIDKRRQQLEKLDLLVKSQFIEMFGAPKINPHNWEKCKFEDICNLITDGEHATPKRTDSGIYLLSARNVLNHKLSFDDVDYIDDNEYLRISKRIVPQKDDILISCSGSVGRVCVVPDNLKFQMVRSVALIRLKKNINPYFLEQEIMLPYIQEQINSEKTQSSQANLFQGKIKKLVAIIPPIELQNKFADFVKQTDKSKFEINKSLEKLETLKKALMQEYFG